MGLICKELGKCTFGIIYWTPLKFKLLPHSTASAVTAGGPHRQAPHMNSKDDLSENSITELCNAFLLVCAVHQSTAEQAGGSVCIILSCLPSHVNGAKETANKKVV